MNYIPLNVKTHYEILDSLIKVNDLISYAKKNNILSLGITDSNMFSSMEFYSSCILNNIKPIIGIEINILEYNFYLYATSYDGYVNLCELVSIKNSNNLDFEIIKKYNNDLICVCSKDNYEYLNSLFNRSFISFVSAKEYNEAIKVSSDVVYFPKIKYFRKEDSVFYKYIKCISLGKTNDEEIVFEESYFCEESNELFIKTTFEFSSLINITFPNSYMHLPEYTENSKEFFINLCKKGLNKRLNNEVSIEYSSRLEYEINVIEKMGFINYFLIVYDFILYAKKHNISVGPGRGSAAGSLVSYSIGITEIDPVKYDLIFERFLNPNRVTMPDIDVDFDSRKREDVISYVKSKYGNEYVSNVISFNTMLPKQIIRDMGKVLNINLAKIDKLCKTISNEKDFIELKNNSMFLTVISRDNSLKDLVNICSKLCGLIKSTSINASGVIISDVKLSSLVPMYKNGDILLCGISKDYLEALGLIKMDFLSLENLNTIFSIVESINEGKGLKINLNKIPLNDQKVIELFSSGKTKGVFQFNEDGMINTLKSVNPISFDEIVAINALYRPGPRAMIKTYTLRKKGKEKVTYLIKELEHILKSTYGIIIYQEQVLEILRSVCGYTYSEADNIRRAISKKKLSVIESEKSKIIKSITSLGYKEVVGTQLFNEIVKFSEYGFNKSHAVVYSYIAYQMAYLKVYFKEYFYINLLNSSSKSSNLLHEYISEASTLNLKFLNVDINLSSGEFVKSDKGIILPLNIIKNISNAVIEEIVNERVKGQFTSFYDFLTRCYSSTVNKRVVVSLVECGAFNTFNLNKKQTVNNLDIIIDYINLVRDVDSSLIPKPLLEKSEDYNDSECLDNEINYYGFYLSHHPVTKYDRNNLVKTNEVKFKFDKYIDTILYVENIKVINTKKNDKMAFISLSDEFGKIEGILFPKDYITFSDIEKSKCYKFKCHVEKRENDYQLIINNILNI